MTDNAAPSRMAQLASQITRAESPLVLICLVLVTAAIFHPIHNVDLFLNIATGRHIAAQGAVPVRDFFSFAPYPYAWIEHKWLFDVLMCGIQDYWGFWGLLTTKAFILCCISAVAYRLSAKQALPLALFFLVIDKVVPFLDLRAHLLSYCLFGGSLVLALRPIKQSRIILQYGLLVFWASIHASFVLGVVLAVGSGISFAISKNRGPKALWILGALFLPFALPLLGPYGYKVYVPLFSHATSSEMASYMAEWRPLEPFSSHLPAMAFLCGAIAIGIMRKSAQSLMLALLSTVLLVLAVRSQRFLPYALLAALPAYTQILRKRGIVFAVGLLLPIATASAVANNASQAMLALPNLLRQPDLGPLHDATMFAQRVGIRGKIFASFDFAAYVAGILYPKGTIFIDGRIDLYPVTLFRQYLALANNAADLLAADSTYRFDALFLRWSAPLKDRQFFEHIARDARFALVYLNRDIAVYVRRPQLQGLRGVRELAMIAPVADLSYYKRFPVMAVLSEIDTAQKLGNLAIMPGGLIKATLLPASEERNALVLQLYRAHPDVYLTGLMAFKVLVHEGKEREAQQCFRDMVERFGMTPELQRLVRH